MTERDQHGDSRFGLFSSKFLMWYLLGCAAVAVGIGVYLAAT